ncbi:MAG: hypothetical protein P3A28_03195 [Gemmatimonadota bacterium]|nr:hypothetical protein [Gemmatimonadota bacterium]
MKRTPHRPQSLKHLPFFEVLAATPEGSPEAKLATAGLLSLRMIDHWVLAGPAIVEPESVSVRSVRQAIMALSPREAVREALLTIVNTMQMLRHVDLVPVLPRVFAYAQLLETHHGALALAADAYETVIRLADPEYDADLVMDSYQRLAFCQRKLGHLDAATESAGVLVKVASRRKDRARALRGKIGLAHVAMVRGDLASADSQFVAVAVEAQKHGLTREWAAATHDRAVVASRSGNVTNAVVLAHQALKQTTDPVDRDRVLGDLAAFLVKLEQYDAALDALRILEVTAVSDEPRQAAKVNIMAAAARSGNRALFESARRALNGIALNAEFSVNFKIETARGLSAFGDRQAALEVLTQAATQAATLEFRPAVEEIQALRAVITATPAPSPIRKVTDRNAPTFEVATDLRRMAAELVSAA